MPTPLKCFVFMSFDPQLHPVRDAIRLAVDKSNDRSQGIRADDIFRPGNAVDHLTEAIKEADFCIAETTGNNPNVMWELGYARAMKKSVIIVRQENDIEIPFDLRSDRVFVYHLERLDDLVTTLVQSIKELVLDLRSRQPFLGWRYDEMTDMKDRLNRCQPNRSGKSLLTILRHAVARVGRFRWQPSDVLRLMEAIRSDSSSSEHQNAFWWLIVHGVFIYGQIEEFQLEGSNGVATNSELVTLSTRGIALLDLLADEKEL